MSNYQMNQDVRNGSGDEYMDLFAGMDAAPQHAGRPHMEREDDVIAPPPNVSVSVGTTSAKKAEDGVIAPPPSVSDSDSAVSAKKAEDGVIAPPPSVSDSDSAVSIHTTVVSGTITAEKAPEPAAPATEKALEHAAHEAAPAAPRTRKKAASAKPQTTAEVLANRHSAAAEHIAAYSDIVRNERLEIRHDVMLQVNAKESLGTNLRRMRNLVGLSVEVASQKTKIRLDYIQQLESDSLRLPYVYTSAYVRTLAHLYGLSADKTEELMPLLHDLLDDKEEIPDNLLQNVKKHEVVDEKEQQRVKKVFITACIGAVVFVAVVIWLICEFVSAPSTPARPATTYRPDIPLTQPADLEPLAQSADLEPVTQPADLEPVTQPIDPITHPIDPAPIAQTDVQPIRPQGVTASSSVTVTEADLQLLVAPEILAPSVLKRSKTPGIRP